MTSIDPQLLQYLAKVLGPQLTPQHIQGALLAKGMEEYSKALQPKAPPGPKNPQAGGQVQVNRQIPGPGPLRSGTGQDQLALLAQLLSNQGFGQQISRMGMVPPRQPGPAPGIPGVPGPTMVG